MGQKEPPRPDCYGKSWVRKSHKDPGVRFVMDKRGPERAMKTRGHDSFTDKSGTERAAKTRGYDFLRLVMGQKEPPIPGGTICYG